MAAIKAFLAPILFVLAYVSILGGIICLPPFLLDFHTSHQASMSFLYSALLCILIGIALLLYIGLQKLLVSTRQLYLITVSSWFWFACIGAIPLYLGIPSISFTDAFFEAMSGITTTGSTVLSGLDTLPHSFLLWRALLQWCGGIGIIVLGIAILPYLRVGGMKMFATESSDWSGKTVPHTHKFIQNIGGIYIGLTMTACVAYWLAGMGVFDAITHSMTTLATGGYSNYDASMGHFNDRPLILWASSFFMLMGALPFSLYVSFLHGNREAFFKDSQVRGFLTFVAICIFLFSIERAWSGSVDYFASLTQVTFNVISVITTCGYASDDYTQWGSYAVIIFFYIMFIGGCSGSTSGAMKFFRFQVALVLLKNQLFLMRHPRAVIPSNYNGKEISTDITRSVMAFSFFFAFTIALLALLLSLTGLDFITSMSAAATAVTNVGPGLGPVVGPAGNFSSLSDTAKWLLCLGMLIGRLEIMTVIVIFTRAFWRR